MEVNVMEEDEKGDRRVRMWYRKLWSRKGSLGENGGRGGGEEGRAG